MPFGIGFGELILIGLILVVVFGSTKLPGSGDSLGRLLRGERPSPPRLLLQRQKSWTPSDWALLIAAIVVGAAALALLLRGH